ncbi:metal-dependent hydrolase family protein [Lentisalinibacter orientalis]|uniref:metal-dependent hydrolase family protein n=1 Tax=Lentisalinibacter orientalis TaxID=2992241 RepID=UPI0038681767
MPTDVRVLDLREHFVLPGLIDAHVHITSESGPGFKLRRVVQSGHDQVISGVMNARTTLLAGFTTVRDTAGFRGNDFEAVFALRDGIADGKVAGPRLLVAGQGIGPTAGHGDFLGYRPDILKLLRPPSLCDGADECRKATRYMVKRGADFIKIAVTGGVTSEINAGLDQQMTDDEISAVVETAHALGRKVAAHAHGKNGIETALRLGVDSIEHGTFMDERTAKLFREKGVFLVPTLLAQKAAAERVANDSSLPEAVREKSKNRSATKRDQVRMAYREGVKMAFGTDSAISPHGRNAEEFALLVEAGVQPMDAIKMATLNAADLLGVEAVTGSIVEGKSADIIAVKRNPLEDIRALEDVAFVMKEGIVYKPCDCGDPSE